MKIKKYGGGGQKWIIVGTYSIIQITQMLRFSQTYHDKVAKDMTS